MTYRVSLVISGNAWDQRETPAGPEAVRVDVPRGEKRKVFTIAEAAPREWVDAFWKYLRQIENFR